MFWEIQILFQETQIVFSEPPRFAVYTPVNARHRIVVCHLPENACNTHNISKCCTPHYQECVRRQHSLQCCRKDSRESSPRQSLGIEPCWRRWKGDAQTATLWCHNFCTISRFHHLRDIVSPCNQPTCLSSPCLAVEVLSVVGFCCLYRLKCKHSFPEHFHCLHFMTYFANFRRNAKTWQQELEGNDHGHQVSTVQNKHFTRSLPQKKHPKNNRRN